MTIAANRLLVAALLLLPVYARALRPGGWGAARGHLRQVLLPAFFLAAHFSTWAVGARLTLAAHGSLIVNLSPIVLPFVMFVFYREMINCREVLGTMIAMLGVGALVWEDCHMGGDTLAGDITCFVSMVLFCFYLAYGRLSLRSGNLWLYVVPMYAVAGLMCFVASLPFANPLEGWSLREAAILLALVVLPTIAGHTIFNHSMAKLRAQIVTVVNLAQFVFAGILAYFIFAEIPKAVFYLTSLLIIMGAVIVIANRAPSSLATATAGELDAD